MAKPRVDDPLTVEQLHKALTYDPLTGIFRWRYRKGLMRVLVGNPAGTPQKNGYTYIRLQTRFFLAHRLAVFYTSGIWPAEAIDHIDRDRSNNALANLRPATKSENMKNQIRLRRNSSGFKGVYWHKGARKWVAQICSDNTHHYLGLFPTAETAHAAWREAATRLHGEFARFA